VTDFPSLIAGKFCIEEFVRPRYGPFFPCRLDDILLFLLWGALPLFSQNRRLTRFPWFSRNCFFFQISSLSPLGEGRAVSSRDLSLFCRRDGRLCQMTIPFPRQDAPYRFLLLPEGRRILPPRGGEFLGWTVFFSRC